MSEALSATLKSLGLSDEQISKLAALQEAGRGIDFVYHYTDVGKDPRHEAVRFDEFHGQLKAFSEEGEVQRSFAAELWDHLTPRLVGWRPEFIEGVEARELGSVLIHLDQQIDAKLGRNIPQELRSASQEVRTRFDDLLFAYEAGSWRDARTSGEVRDELVFVASVDEKIRNVLYGNAYTVDLRKMIEEYSPVRQAGDRYLSDTGFEVRAYQAQLATVSDILDRLRAAGIEVHSGLTIKTLSEVREKSAALLADGPTRTAPVHSSERKQSAVASRPSADANRYWQDVAHSASIDTGIRRSESLVQSMRRGRSL
jgi:hypothetical protein